MSRPEAPTGSRRAVLAFGWACVGVWTLQWFGQGLPSPSGAEGLSFSAWLAQTFAFRSGGAWWQPLTYGFLHGSWGHLAANLAGLTVTGLALSKALGGLRFWALALQGMAWGAVGFALSLACDARLGTVTVCMGASSALAATLGAASVLAFRKRVVAWVAFVPVRLRAAWLVPLFLVWCAVEAWGFPRETAYGAHLGGFLAGMGCGLWWRRYFR